MKRGSQAVWIGLVLCLGVIVGCKRPAPTLAVRVVDIQISSQTDGTAAERGAPMELDT